MFRDESVKLYLYSGNAEALATLPNTWLMQIMLMIIVLMSDTLQDAQTLLHRVEEAALDVGLSINTNKTKAILIGQEDQNVYTLDGNNIETVEDFQRLGVWIVDSKKEVRTRKAKAWSVMLNLNSIWRSDMNRRLKVNFFKAAVESILLYGSECCWTLTKEEEHRLASPAPCSRHLVVRSCHQWRTIRRPTEDQWCGAETATPVCGSLCTLRWTRCRCSAMATEWKQESGTPRSHLSATTGEGHRPVHSRAAHSNAV